MGLLLNDFMTRNAVANFCEEVMKWKEDSENVRNKMSHLH